MSSAHRVVVALWFVAGCAAADAPAEDPSNATPYVGTTNGRSPNGVSINGRSPNGITLNGINGNGRSPNGTAIGLAASGPPLTGAGIVGSTWTGNLSDGTTVALRLDGAQQGTGANTDVWSYLISSSAADGTWSPVCVDSSGNPIYADTVAGSWNLAVGVTGGGSYNPAASGYSIACRGSAIAKCVELGYKPWAGHATDLAACVRALRGDYCGDGTPYTVDGTIVNIFDVDGIQRDDAAWTPEAAWTANGALCVSKKKQTRFDQDANQRPWCYPHAVKPSKSCGEAFTDGALIITELP